jgi:uncharacterized UBP type Zn finger protein
MGFPLQKASQALIETQNRHLAAALDWLEQHPDWTPSLSQTISHSDPFTEKKREDEELKRARELVCFF